MPELSGGAIHPAFIAYLEGLRRTVQRRCASGYCGSAAFYSEVVFARTLREPEVSHLKAFLDGSCFADAHISGRCIGADFNEFEKWLRDRIQPTTRCSWDMLLTSVCGGDGVQAFLRFFNELREFEEKQHLDSDKGS